MDTTSGSVVIDGVEPADAWALISDVTRTGEWSPENTGGRWIGGASAPVEGARFVGHNRNGVFRWWTTCRVVAAVPGRRFAFDVSAGPVQVARWDWTLQPVDGGTEVTLAWTDRRAGPLGWMMRNTGIVAVGARIDRAHVQRNIARSLERLPGLLAR